MRGLSALRRASADESVLLWGWDWECDSVLKLGRDGATVLGPVGSGERDITPNVRWSLRGKMMMDSSSPGIGGSAFWRAVVNADMRSRREGWWPMGRDMKCVKDGLGFFAGFELEDAVCDSKGAPALWVER